MIVTTLPNAGKKMESLGTVHACFCVNTHSLINPLPVPSDKTGGACENSLGSDTMDAAVSAVKERLRNRAKEVKADAIVDFRLVLSYYPGREHHQTVVVGYGEAVRLA